jgi:hypothetical protein
MTLNVESPMPGTALSRTESFRIAGSSEAIAAPAVRNAFDLYRDDRSRSSR